MARVKAEFLFMQFRSSSCSVVFKAFAMVGTSMLKLTCIDGRAFVVFALVLRVIVDSADIRNRLWEAV